MYKHVLARELKNLKFGYAKKPRNLPTMLNAEEMQKILNCMLGKYWLITAILYGCGLRVLEALRLRGKDRYTLLPQSLAESIKNQMSIAKKCHDKDMCEGLAWHLFPLPLHSLESMVMLLNK
jgi:integrase